MAATSMPENAPLRPGHSANDDDDTQDRENQNPPDRDWEDEEKESEEDGVSVEEVDFNDVENVLKKTTDEDLVASKIIPAKRGYTIEQLQKLEPDAWSKASERFLKIAVHKYRDIVQFCLPGVGEDDAKSAVGEIVPDFVNNIAKYPSLPQLDAAFRTALINDIRSLQRKFLALKRGTGKTDITPELHGLNQKDEPAGQDSYDADDKASASALEGKVNREYGGWSSLQNVGANVTAHRRDQKKLMSEAMDELEPAEKQILQWSVIDALKQREIADRLGIGVSSVGIRINRAKAKLKKLVGEKILSEKKELL